jgi:hypothetical protein
VKVWVLVRPYDGAISEVFPTRAAARRSTLHRLAKHRVRRAVLIQMDRPFSPTPKFAGWRP